MALENNLLLSVEGRFDLPEADRVLRWLALLGRTRAIVDFRAVLHRHDRALERLARAIDGLAVELELRGLTAHERTLLTYLGRSPTTLRPARSGPHPCGCG
ncbi:MAG: hypothetical protein ACK4N5_20055 [Myxococcales bacterium]